MSTPERIGPFQVLSELGRGGMGTVYKVRDPGGKTLALKLLHQATGERSHRFRREFRAASRLRHPNIVAVFDAGTEPGPFFTMEFIEGLDLLRFVHGGERGKPLAAGEPTRRLFFAVGQVLKALDYVHAAGIVHRDLKPDNILVNREGAVKVTDFGLAKLEEPDSFETAHGTVLGTMAYSAPEQLGGGAVDARSDLYSLGVILFEALTGRTPWTGLELRLLLVRKLTADAPSPRELAPDIAPEWEGILARLLDREPANRYAGISPLLADLRRLKKRLLGEARGAAPGGEPAEAELLTRSRSALHLPRFLGRATEMERVGRVLDRAVEGRGGVVLVSGEAGIGKTRLVDAVRAAARAKGVKVALATAPASPVAYGHFLPVLERVAGRLALWDDKEVVEAVTAEGGALRLLHPRFNLVPGMQRLAPVVSLPPRETRDRDLRVLVALFRALVARGATLLVVEDLHHADAATVALLEQLASRVASAAGSPLVVLATYREEELEPDSPATAFVDGQRAALRIALQRLGRAEVRDVVATMADGVEADDELADRLLAETGGNPFLVEETVRALVAEGALVRRQGRWTVDDAALARALPARAETGARPVPAAMERALESHLGRFDRDTREVLEAGAVAGESFLPGVVARAVLLPEERVLDAIAEGLAARLLVEPEHDRAPYRFQPAKVREVLVKGLGAERARLLHGRVGRALEESGDAPLEELAHHFARAGEPEKALVYLPEAARRSAERYANAQALGLYERALALLAELRGAKRPRELEVALRPEAARVAELPGKHDEAIALLGAAEQAASAGGLWRESAAALNALAQLVSIRGEYREARVLALRAYSAAHAAGDRVGLARALDVLGLVARREEHYESAAAFFREAVPLKEGPGAALAVAEGLRNLAIVARKQERHDEARRALHRALALERNAGNRRGMAACLAELGAVHLARCEYDAALERLTEALDLEREIGNVRGVGLALLGLGGLQLQVGEYAPARASLEEALALFRQLRDRRSEAVALLDLGHVAYRTDEPMAAIRHYEQGEEILAGLGELAARSEALSALAAAEARLGRGEEAGAHATEAIKLARQGGSREKEAWALLTLARASGDVVAARRAVELAERAGDTNLLFQTLLALGLALREEGDEEGARRALTRSLATVEHLAAGLQGGREAFLRKPAVREVYAAALGE